MGALLLVHMCGWPYIMRWCCRAAEHCCCCCRCRGGTLIQARAVNADGMHCQQAGVALSQCALRSALQCIVSNQLASSEEAAGKGQHCFAAPEGFGLVGFGLISCHSLSAAVAVRCCMHVMRLGCLQGHQWVFFAGLKLVQSCLALLVG